MDIRCREDGLARFDGEAPVLSAVYGVVLMRMPPRLRTEESAEETDFPLRAVGWSSSGITEDSWSFASDSSADGGSTPAKHQNQEPFITPVCFFDSTRGEHLAWIHRFAWMVSGCRDAEMPL